MVRLSVVAVLFTQGINEQQTLANNFGHDHVIFQDQLNKSSCQQLEQTRAVPPFLLTRFFSFMWKTPIGTANDSVE